MRVNSFSSRRSMLGFASAFVVTAALGLTGSSAVAGGHHRQRVVLVPAATSQVTREVYREVEAPATRTVIYREVVRTVEPDPRETVPTPQAAPKAPAPSLPPTKETPRATAQDLPAEAPTVVRERYIIRERVVAPVTTRIVIREVSAPVRTVVRVLVPVERYVVREVQAEPSYLIVRPKHHLLKGW